MIPTLVSFNGINQLTYGLVGGESVDEAFPLGLGLVTFGFLWGSIWVRCCDPVSTSWTDFYSVVSTSWSDFYSPVTTIWTRTY